jgi:ribosomal protein L40E
MRAICRTAIELGLTVDHVMPIAGCRGCGAKGLHEPQNMALLSQARNASKGARCMRCWARDSGRSSGK